MISQDSCLRSRGERDLNNFYSKIRAHLDEPLFQDDDHKPNIGLKDVPDENFYGKISKEEFEKVLNSYEKQQECTNTKDAPVACDREAGQSFAKLLFSKKGFHCLGSTRYLTSDLGIKDADRCSFLAGISSYKIDRYEDVQGLRKNHRRLLVKMFLDEAKKHLNKDTPAIREAKDEIIKALRVNPRSADALSVRGRYNFITNNFQEASRDFGEALRGELEDEDRDYIKLQLSESLCSHALANFYHKGDHRGAVPVFTEALRYNPQNESAKLHLGICEDKIRSSGFRTSIPNYRTQN